MDYTLLDNLADPGLIPADGILSRTVLDTPEAKLVIFYFAQGEELSEHTAALPALIQSLSGTMRLTLGGDTHELEPGAVVHMPAHLTHAVYAETPLIMLLQMSKVSSA